MTRAKFALIAAGIAAVGVGGFFANEEFACRAMADEYLEETAAIATNLQSRRVYDSPVVDDDVDQRNARAMEKANRIFIRIRQRCGVSAADSAQRQAEEIIAQWNAG